MRQFGLDWLRCLKKLIQKFYSVMCDRGEKSLRLSKKIAPTSPAERKVFALVIKLQGDFIGRAIITFNTL